MMASAADYQKQIADLSGENAYSPGKDLADANARIGEINAGKPVEYTQKDADRLNGVFDQIMGAGKFSYDPAGDSVFRQARSEYMQGGQTAAQQTQQAVRDIGGGYGNTWGASVAGQQYGEYIKGANDILPAMEQNAYQGYTSEIDRLQNLYQTGMQREETEYNRYRDSLNDWRTDRDYAVNAADQAYQRDYQRYSDQMTLANNLVGWQREDTNNDRSQAYDWALKLLEEGIMPNADILATAGISTEDAQAYYDEKHHSGGGRRKRKGGGSTSTPTVDTDKVPQGGL